MNRKRELLIELLDRLDDALLSSYHLFIYAHPKLREDAGWEERPNVVQVKKDNHEEILALTEEALKLL